MHRLQQRVSNGGLFGGAKVFASRNCSCTWTSIRLDGQSKLPIKVFQG